MPFELEFLPVGDGENSGDAIVGRYQENGVWSVFVIDAGYLETGQNVCDHIRRYYNTEVIDHVVSTHPDNDHMSGLRVVLEQMRVRNLWMHVPHFHANEILHLFRSRRWQLENLKTALERAYPYVIELLQLAAARGTNVRAPFAGEQIGCFTVLSPTAAMYEGLLPQFRDTPAPDQDMLVALGHWITGIGKRIARTIVRNVRENWGIETLREGGTTAAENESSVILYATFEYGGVLLTGDAGLRALGAAASYATTAGFGLRDALHLFQLPHHGSRNNISPSMLNAIVGPPVAEGAKRNIRCIISAGADDPTHPRQVVVNALVRRGVQAWVTRGQTVRFHAGVERAGWNALPTLGFDPEVEAYD